jgi:hypothetical protein
MLPAPRVDSRTSDQVVQQVLQLLLSDAGLTNFAANQGASRALIEIFGRFAELIIERLNQVPKKNLLAFLDLIGASVLPPQSARVPLTFILANGSTVDGVVPAGTQVAAVQSEGETAPVIFETEEELVVTAAQLTSVFMRQPDLDKYADYSSLTNSISVDEVPAFLGNRRIEHILYIGHDTIFCDPGLNSLTLNVATNSENLSALVVKWETWDGRDWTELIKIDDKTSGLTKSADVTFSDLSPLLSKSVNGNTKAWLRCRLTTPISPAAFKKEALPVLNPVKIIQAEFKGTGLKAESAITNDTPADLVKGFYPFGERPKAGDALYLAHQEAFKKPGAAITLTFTVTNSPKPDGVGLAWEFWDGTTWSALTSSSDDTNSLTKNGKVALTVPGQPVATTINGLESFWIRVRIAAGNYGEEAHFAVDPKDPTKYVPVVEGDPSKGYKLVPANLAPPFINSLVIDYRATQRLPATPRVSANPPVGPTQPAGPTQPGITTGPVQPFILPEAVLTYNDFEYRDVTKDGSFAPFHTVSDTHPTLYLGFTLPAGLPNFPNRKISLYPALFEFKMGENLVPVSPGTSRSWTDMKAPAVTHNFIVTNPTAQPVVYLCKAKCEPTANGWTAAVDEEISVPAGKSQDLVVRVTVPDGAKNGESARGFLTLKLKSATDTEYNADFITYVGTPAASQKPELVWQYSRDLKWPNLTVRDHSENLTKAGLIEFLAPPDFQESTEFGLSRYWLRVSWQSGEYLFEPRLRGILLNTTMATQAVTISDEVLGSSSETASQQFRTNRAPVLKGPLLYVREPELPPANEQIRIEDESTGAAIHTVTDATGRPQEIWVRWTQTPDFYGSGARDRHYVLDNLTGEVRFGDGQSGLIPPAGTGNIRMSRYRTGGGAVGNKPAGAITQLKTTVPYIQQVVNYLPASGGSESENIDSLLQRAPRTLRHGDRAVTIKDYEDLAMLASTEVARARCVPLTNLLSDESAGGPKSIANGTVSLIIVPRSTEIKSSPGTELIGRVEEFVGRRHNPVADLVVTGPKYLAINVNVDLTPVSLDGAGELKLLIGGTISSYLHPLTGGIDGNGWDFGRYPHRSNLIALIEALPGVDHVNTLDLTPAKTSDEVKKAGEYFLVCSGGHTISLTT